MYVSEKQYLLPKKIKIFFFVKTRKIELDEITVKTQ